MGDPDTAATGAVMRPATLRRYARQAGFRDVEVLPVDAGMLRFYRLTPLPRAGVWSLCTDQNALGGDGCA